MTSHLVPPHGSRLVDLMASPARVAELNAHAKEMASWSLTPRQLADLELLLSGAFSPSGASWGAPRPRASAATCGWQMDVLASSHHARDQRGGGEGPGAWSKSGSEGRGRSPQRCATPRGSVADGASGDAGRTVSVAGLSEGVEAPHHYDFVEIRTTPARMREQFAKWGWRKVAAFHTGEVMHRAEHELTLAAAASWRRACSSSSGWPPTPGGTRPLLAHPVPAGADDGLPAGHGPPQPATSRPARGGRARPAAERGRGPELRVQPLHRPGSAAGAGDEILARPRAASRSSSCAFRRGSTARPRYLRGRGRSSRGGGEDDCPSELAERLAWARDPLVVLIPRGPAGAAAEPPPRSRQGFTVFFTGLPSSGKSTLANVLMVKLLQMGGRPVTLLDGDIVRKHLSSELGFSREHRNLNIARIGFVASEITKNNGIALCAPIAPYGAVRKQVRAMIEPHGLPPRARLDPDRGVRAAGPQGALRQGTGGDRKGVHRGVGSLRGAAGRRARDRHLGAQPGGMRAGDPPAPREGGLHRAANAQGPEA